jgi:aspartate kinase
MENFNDRSPRPCLGVDNRRALKVLKFGGTSVGSSERLRGVVEIVRGAAQTHRVVVVTLVAALDAMHRGTFSKDALAEGLWARYHVLASGLLRPATLRVYERTLRDLLRASAGRMANTPPTPAMADEVLALGERLAAPLLALALRDASLSAMPQDAAALICTDDTFGEALVHVAETYRRARAWHAGLPDATIPVVTGFIGATASAQTTTLGRGGSDYSAALLAAALRASVLERWTDVDGLYTDDPSKNRQARRLRRICLEDAWAWNHAGRLGMHRKALDPLVKAEIPVHVRSTAAPEGPGTWILPAGYEPITAVAS